jgi:hypothetical protein
MLNAQSIGSVALDTIGINGLDSQTTATALGNEWFTKADNITYTEGGKVTFRKGLKQGTLDSGSKIGSIVEHITSTDTKQFVSYGGTVAELDLTDKDAAFINTYSPAGVTTSDWQFHNFNNKLVGVQDGGVKPILYDSGTWKYLEDVVDTTSTGTEINAGSFNVGTRYSISEIGTTDFTTIGSASNTIGVIFTATGVGSGSGKAFEGGTMPEGVTTFDPSCSLGYYGRLWVGGITEETDVIHYSALLSETTWWAAAGITDAGYIDLKTVWGKDEIVALHAHAGKLVIFGKENIAIYNNPQAVGVMALDEVIRGIGCVARDSIQAIGEDIYFLSDTGVRSLKRTATFDKLPLQEISPTIKDELIANIKTGSDVKSVYIANEGLYLITFVDKNVTYVFDLTYPTPKETPRVTKWSFASDRHPASLAYTAEYGLLVGQYTGRVATYEGYWDSDYSGSNVYVETPYTSSISTVWIDLGQGVTASILKKFIMVVSGGQGADVGLRLYKDFEISPKLSPTFKLNPTLSGTPYLFGNSTSLYSTAKYAPIHGLKEHSIPLAGSAKYLRLEMDAVTSGYKASLQSLSLLYKQGKTL